MSIVRESPKRLEFSVDGYSTRSLELQFPSATGCERHTLDVTWPAGATNNDGRPSNVARSIHDGWLRAIVNTLRRLPIDHARLVRRIVIDNRPREHGIAPHDRARGDDGRDGATLWLHEHVFNAPNHWARGNYGEYWNYHVDQDSLTFHEAAADHDLFSPVMLHEIGHLVMYGLVNRRHRGPAATSPPACAAECPGVESCVRRTPLELEAGCVTPYCQPFSFDTRTENWAEQYRLYFQSSAARAAMARASATCLPLLRELDGAGSAPWQRGFADSSHFRPSRWRSCGGTACKGY
jgi:hypothetical protein